MIFWGVTVQRPSPGFLIPCKRARETSRAYYLDERLSLFPHPLRFAVFLIIKAASPAEPLVIRTTFFYCQLWFLLIFFSSRKKGKFCFSFSRMLLPDCAEGTKIVTRKGTASERMLPTGGGCNQGGPAAGPASRFVYKFSKRSERERLHTI